MPSVQSVSWRDSQYHATDSRRAVPMRLAMALALVAAAAGLGWIVRPGVPSAGIVMLFLLAVVLAGLRLGAWPAALTALAGGLSFNFLFTEPRFSFHIHDVGDVLTFGVLLTVGLVVAQLVARVREEARSAREQEEQAVALSEFAAELLRADGAPAIHDAAARSMGKQFDIDVDIVPSRPQQHVDAAANAGILLPLGTRADAPLLALRQRGDVPLPSRRLLEGYASQIALALERIDLMRERSEARLTAQAEEMRTSLLAGLSHDLRTPLASILGSASTILESDKQLAPDAVEDLIATIAEEAVRMNRLVSNLLEMARLTCDAGLVDTAWIPLDELIGSVRNRLAASLRTRRVTVSLPEDLPLLQVDGLLFEQLLQNLLENALKYTPAGSPIDIIADRVESSDRHALCIAVMDRGPGIPDAAKPLIFEKFWRPDHECAQSGLGLGLALCRSIVSLHGGTITVADRPGGGAVFEVEIPWREAPPRALEVEGPQ